MQIAGRAVSLTAHIVMRIGQAKAYNRQRAAQIQLSACARNVPQAEDGVTSHVEMQMTG